MHRLAVAFIALWASAVWAQTPTPTCAIPVISNNLGGQNGDVFTLATTVPVGDGLIVVASTLFPPSTSLDPFGRVWDSKGNGYTGYSEESIHYETTVHYALAPGDTIHVERAAKIAVLRITLGTNCALSAPGVHGGAIRAIPVASSDFGGNFSGTCGNAVPGITQCPNPANGWQCSVSQFTVGPCLPGEVNDPNKTIVVGALDAHNASVTELQVTQWAINTYASACFGASYPHCFDYWASCTLFCPYPPDVSFPAQTAGDDTPWTAESSYGSFSVRVMSPASQGHINLGFATSGVQNTSDSQPFSFGPAWASEIYYPYDASFSIANTPTPQPTPTATPILTLTLTPTSTTVPTATLTIPPPTATAAAIETLTAGPTSTAAAKTVIAAATQTAGAGTPTPTLTLTQTVTPTRTGSQSPTVTATPTSSTPTATPVLGCCNCPGGMSACGQVPEVNCDSLTCMWTAGTVCIEVVP